MCCLASSSEEEEVAKRKPEWPLSAFCCLASLLPASLGVNSNPQLHRAHETGILGNFWGRIKGAK